MVTKPLLLGAALGIALIGCTSVDGRPPIARIDLAPEAIPEHDNFATSVTLDGTRSADPVDDPDGTHPLDFRWEIVGDEGRFESGSHDDEPTPAVTFRGDRPATITLTVTDADGLSASATTYLQLSVP